MQWRYRHRLHLTLPLPDGVLGGTRYGFVVHSINSFRANQFHFCVGTPDPHLLDRVAALLSDLPSGNSEISSDLDLTTDGDLFFLHSEKRMETCSSESSLFAALITLLNRKSLDASPAALHLHAGTVARDGDAILIVASSGSGKTTTTTALASRGWDYLSDETAQIRDGRIHTWPKPLSIKRSGFTTMQQLLGDRIDLDHDDSSWVVTASSLGFSIRHEATARTIVFLDPEAPPTPEPMSAADATVALVQQTMDFERAGPSSLETLAALAAECRLYTIGRTDPTAMAEMIETAALESTHDEPPVAVDTLTIAWARLVTTVQVGDELVIRNGQTGAVASLNAEGAEAIARMAAGTDASELDAGDRAFLDQLRQASLMPMSVTGGQSA